MTRVKRPDTPLARRLRETAQAAGLKAPELADALGKTPAAISHWWNARNEPSFDDLGIYGRLVGRSAYYLLTGEDDPAGFFHAIEESLTAFRAALATGAAPTQALDAIGADRRELTEAQSEQMDGSGASLREYLASAGGEAWLRLTAADRELILRLVWQLARRRSPPQEPR